MTRRLIIAPHADDEALGCGGMIAKYADECTVIILSDKGDGRLVEHERAKKVLGYKDSIVAPFQTGSLTDESRAVTSWLDGVMRDLQPDVLYLPTPDAHQDHSAAYASGIRCARFSYTGQTYFVPAVLLYQFPSYSIDLYDIPYPLSRYELLTEEQLNLKVAAIEEYASQTQGTFSPSDMARAHAQYIGAKSGNGYAENYAVVREVIQ
jgi:N-acetylglucosamine malate deacetylase 1